MRCVEFRHRQPDRLVQPFVVDRIDRHRDMAMAVAIRRLPLVGRILAGVAQLFGACRHALAERQRKAGERAVGHVQRLQPRMADRDAGPRGQILGPVRRRRDVRGEPPQQVATAFGLVDAQHGMEADIGLGPRAQDQRLDVIQLQRYAIGTEPVLQVLEDTHQ